MPRLKPGCFSTHGPKWPCGNCALTLSSQRPTASFWSTDRWQRGIARVSAGAGSPSGTTLLGDIRASQGNILAVLNVPCLWTADTSSQQIKQGQREPY